MSYENNMNLLMKPKYSKSCLIIAVSRRDLGPPYCEDISRAITRKFKSLPNSAILKPRFKNCPLISDDPERALFQVHICIKLVYDRHSSETLMGFSLFPISVLLKQS